mmetsp:Transcript_24439/g.56365  ORF Transcript_24439/g.56365 Transcript_24439/m.56365 type:complete len:3222 (+) Transcript_24439:123-9788(+)
MAVDPSQVQQPPDARQVWEDVRALLHDHEHGQVVYQTTANAIKLANTHFQHPEAKIFLVKCLHPAVNIMLDQQAARLDQENFQLKIFIENALTDAVIIIQKDLAEGNTQHIKTLAQLFNPRRNFYKGFKTKSFHQVPGNMKARSDCILIFCRANGFLALVSAFSQPQLVPPNPSGNSSEPPVSRWPGAEDVRYLITAMGEAYGDGQVLREVASRFADWVQAEIGEMGEEQLKAEPFVVMSALIRQLRRLNANLGNQSDDATFFNFWLDVTLTYIGASSLPMRLFGWEQLAEVIDEACGTRTPAKLCRVQGAGNSAVNGVYQLQPLESDSRDEDLRYTKLDDNTGLLLTLFQCTIQQTTSKWWFISEADINQPGTEKDIDYYKHVQASNIRREPPSTGWECCTAQGEEGVMPPPTCVRLDDDGRTGCGAIDEASLESTLMQRMLKGGVLEGLFGDSIHREIVARSGVLLTFLAEARGLSMEHLNLVWSASLQQSEAELVEEIHQLIASLVPVLNGDYLVHLLDAVRISISKNEQALTGAVALAERLAISNALAVADLPAEVLDSVLKLYWELLENPAPTRLVPKAISAISNFMARSLQSCPNSQHHVVFLERCAVALRASAGAASSLDWDEASTMSALRLMNFVLKNFPRHALGEVAGVVNMLEQQQQLSDLLSDEIQAWQQRSQARRKIAADATDDAVAIAAPVGAAGSAVAQATQRLHLWQTVFGLSKDVALSTDKLAGLWRLLGESSAERELIMAFLAETVKTAKLVLKREHAQREAEEAAKQGPQPAPPLPALTMRSLSRPCFGPQEMAFVFRDLICSANASLMDWTSLGPRAYDCFQVYFQFLARHDQQASAGAVAVAPTPGSASGGGENGGTMELGIDTLWRIVLRCRDVVVADSAKRDLLSVYRDPGLGSQAHFLDRVYRNLSDTLQDLRQAKVSAGGLSAAAVGVDTSASDTRQLGLGVERCLSLLRGAVSASSAAPGAAPQAPAHALRGGSNRRELHVKARRVRINPKPEQHQHKYTSEAVDPFRIFVHPLETIRGVRHKIVTRATDVRPGDPLPPSQLFYRLNKLTDDTAIVRDYWVGNGDEIQATIHLKTNRQTEAEATAAYGGGGLRHIGDVIADHERFYDAMFELLQFCGDGNAGLSIKTGAALWDLLLSIPTQKLVESSVEAAAGVLEAPVEGAIGWSGLISATQWHKSAYTLQTIDSKLQPAPELRPDKATMDTADAFINGFLASGGFKAVVDLFMTPPPSGVASVPSGGSALDPDDESVHSVSVSSLEGMGYAASLRIINFLLRKECQERTRRNQERAAAAAAVAAAASGPMPMEEVEATGGIIPPPAINTGAATAAVAPPALAPLADEPEEILKSTGVTVTAMLHRLVDVALCAHDGGFADLGSEVVIDAIHTINSVMMQPSYVASATASPTTLPPLLTSTSAERFVVSIIVDNPVENVRILMAKLLMVCGKRSLPLALTVFGWLTRRLSELPSDCETSKSILQVLDNYLESPDIGPRLSSDGYLKNLGQVLVQRVTSFPRQTTAADDPTLVASAARAAASGKPSSTLAGVNTPPPSPQTAVATGATAAQPPPSPLSPPRPPGRNETPSSMMSTSSTNGGSGGGGGAGPSASSPVAASASMVSCMLDLIRSVVTLDKTALEATALSPDLIVTRLYRDILFALPTLEKRHLRPLCSAQQPETMESAFQVIKAAAADNADDLRRAIQEVNTLSAQAQPILSMQWNIECSYDTKPTATKYVGLRNQGCTCYMNATLQNLFMIPLLRETILNGPVSYPRKISGEALTEETVVNQLVLLEREDGSSTLARVIQWHSDDSTHDVELLQHAGGATTPPRRGASSSSALSALSAVAASDLEGSREDAAALAVAAGAPLSTLSVVGTERFNVYKGRPGLETGRLHIYLPPIPSAPLSTETSEDKDRRVLEQIQRTFMYLSRSEKRFLDPRPLVEACKYSMTNLQNDVYDQNDADEFLVQLLDKVEVGFKQGGAGGAECLKQLKLCFGGKLDYQKIPKEGDDFPTTTTREAFNHLQLKVLGMDTIHDSLAAFVEGELMDGDNKVEFDDGVKRACVRRTCIGTLPNVLVLHLKRFEFDYNTFETMKLNSRCAFPEKLNMRPYTTQGIAEAEAAAAAAEERKKEADDGGVKAGGAAAGSDGTKGADDPNGSVPSTEEGAGGSDGAGGDAGNVGGGAKSELEDEDFMYELRGVLIHSGVAQSGHYYAFVRERESADDVSVESAGGVSAEAGDGGGGGGQWFRFDDDEVSEWDSSQLERECFGGTVVKSWNGVPSQIEHELIANAFMLFYDKVKPATAEEAEDAKTPTSKEAADKSDALSNVTEDDMADNMSVDSVVKTPRGGKEEGSGEVATAAQEEAEGKEAKMRATLPLVLTGSEAYDEEVFNSNVTFLRRSYLFGASFHQHLRDLLAGCLGLEPAPASPLRGGRGNGPRNNTPHSPAGDARSIQRPDLSRMFPCTRPAPPGSPGAAARAAAAGGRDNSTLWLELVQCGLTFLLDVVLHSRERRGVKQWHEIFVGAFAYEPVAAQWFIQALCSPTERSGTWLRSFLLLCPDVMARNSFVRLVAHAVAALAPREEGMLREAAAHARKAAGGGVAGAVERTAAAAGGSTIVALVEEVTELMSQAPQYWRNADELFLLVRDLAASNDALREYMVGTEMIARLSLFVAGEKATEVIKGRFLPHSFEPPAPDLDPQARAAFYASQQQIVAAAAAAYSLPDFMYLLEAIAALVDVHQVTKAELLECDDYQRADLTPGAKAALAAVFADNCGQLGPMAGMGQNDLAAYLEQCGSASSNIRFQVQSILAKYDTTNEGRLSQAGFFSYYCESALTRPKEVWHNLHAAGFRNDLTRGDMSQQGGAQPLDEIMQRPSLSLPPVSMEALTSFTFYQAANDSGGGGDGPILQRVCLNDNGASQTILQACLGELSNAAPGWHGENTVTLVKFMLEQMLELDDPYVQARLETILISDNLSVLVYATVHYNSLVNSYQAQQQGQEQTQANFNQDMQSRQVVERYIGVMRTLLKCPHAARYLNECQPRWDWMRDWQQHPVSGNYQSYHEVSPKQVELSSAGADDVNGIYTYDGTCDNAPKYVKSGGGGGVEGDDQFVLYRCKLQDNQHQWYISIVQAGQQPGTNEDVDFYYAPSISRQGYEEGYEANPPEKGWVALPPKGFSPAPEIYLITSDDEADEADLVSDGETQAEGQG